ncbi:hypothetical protein SERLA73DRAFT_140760, partial [Serpula lacrymans var. lacrymans S7.3]
MIVDRHFAACYLIWEGSMRYLFSDAHFIIQSGLGKSALCIRRSAPTSDDRHSLHILYACLSQLYYTIFREKCPEKRYLATYLKQGEYRTRHVHAMNTFDLHVCCCRYILAYKG